MRVLAGSAGVSRGREIMEREAVCFVFSTGARWRHRLANCFRLAFFSVHGTFSFRSSVQRSHLNFPNLPRECNARVLRCTSRYSESVLKHFRCRLQGRSCWVHFLYFLVCMSQTKHGVHASSIWRLHPPALAEPLFERKVCTGFLKCVE